MLLFVVNVKEIYISSQSSPDSTKPLPEAILTQDYYYPFQGKFTENVQAMLAKFLI